MNATPPVPVPVRTDVIIPSSLTAAFWEKVRASRRIVLASHLNPDGDAVGSLLGLYHTLLAMDKEPVMICHDPAPDHLAFLPGADLIRAASETGDECRGMDLAIILDCSHPSRLGDVLECVRGARQMIVVDHHGDAQTLPALHIVDVYASSAGELVYRLIRDAGQQISPAAALCLYVAILTDTGSFRYGNTSAAAFAIASELLQSGSIDVHSIGIHIFARDTVARLKLRGMVFDRVHLEDGIIHSLITPDMLEESGCTAMEAEGLIDDLALCRDAEIAVMFWRLPDGVVRIQLRSIRDASVLPVARAVGGGGHLRAAGSRMRGIELEDARRRVLAAARQSLRGTLEESAV